MQRKLILIRHGDAPRLLGQSDRQRELSEFGEQQSQAVATLFNNLALVPQLIIASDAPRAKRTAELIQISLSTHTQLILEPNLYNCAPETIVQEISAAPDEIANLAIVAHNPGITSVLSKFQIMDKHSLMTRAMNFEATCKIVVLSAQSKSWGEFSTSPLLLELVFWPD